MAYDWFRMYAEWAEDPKVQMMTEALQRRLAMLFCFRCRNVSETFQDEEIAFRLRVSLEDALTTKAAFRDKGFIDEEWRLLNWTKRQYASDSSSDRVKAFRERKKQAESSNETERNVSETPPDTDTDTEKTSTKATPRKRVATAYAPPEWVQRDSWEAFVAMRKQIRAPLTDRAAELTVRELDKLRGSGNDPAEVLDQSTRHSWRGVFPLKTEPSGGSNGRTGGNQGDHTAPAAARVGNTQNAIRAAAHAQGWFDSDDAAGADGRSESEPGSGGGDADVPGVVQAASSRSRDRPG